MDKIGQRKNYPLSGVRDRLGEIYQLMQNFTRKIWRYCFMFMVFLTSFWLEIHLMLQAFGLYK